MEQKLLKVREVCELLQIKPTTAYALITRGELRAVAVGGSYRFTQAEITRFIEQGAKAKRQEVIRAKAQSG